MILIFLVVNPLLIPGFFCFLKREVIMVIYFNQEKWRKMLSFLMQRHQYDKHKFFLFYIVQLRTLCLLPLLRGSPENSTLKIKLILCLTLKESRSHYVWYRYQWCPLILLQGRYFLWKSIVQKSCHQQRQAILLMMCRFFV